MKYALFFLSVSIAFLMTSSLAKASSIDTINRNQIIITSQTGNDVGIDWRFAEINDTHWLVNFAVPYQSAIKDYPLVSLSANLQLSKTSIDQTKENSFYIIFPRGFQEGLSARFGSKSTIIVTQSNYIDIGRMPQRKLFYVNNSYWVFYCNTTTIGYRTSADGITWSAFINANASARLCGASEHVEVNWFPEWNTKQFFFVFANGLTLTPATMWRANISVTNSLIIESENTIVLASLFLSYTWPSIGVATTGHLYVSFNRGTGAVKRWVLYNNSNNTGFGTWTLNATFSDNALAIGDFYNGGIYPLPNGSMMNIYGDGLNVFYKYFNNTTARWTEEASLSTYCYKDFGAVGDGIGNIYFSCGQQIGLEPNPIFKLWNTSNIWSAYENVTKWLPDAYRVHLSLDNTTKDVYVLFENATSNKIIYVKRNNLTSSWGSPTVWETGIGIGSYTISPEKYASNNKIGVAWEEAQVGNYTIAFNTINTAVTPPPTPPSEEKKTLIMVIGIGNQEIYSISGNLIIRGDKKYLTSGLTNENTIICKYQEISEQKLCLNLNSGNAIYLYGINGQNNDWFSSIIDLLKHFFNIS